MIRYATVSEGFNISPSPPSDPGVYLFLAEGRRIMYVGMAHDLQAILYRYRGLEGREHMRERLKDGRFSDIAWIAASHVEGTPALERVAISRFRPPWNDQHNPYQRSEEDAISLSDREEEWLVAAERELDDVISLFTDGSDQRTPPTRPPKERWEDTPMDKYTVRDLEDKLAQFEAELRAANLKETSIRTYVDRTQIFLRWLAGTYSPRGPNT